MRWVEVHTSRYSQVLMQIENFDNLTFLTALVVFNQSNEWNDTYRVIIVNIVLSSLSISSSCWYRSLCFGWIREFLCSTLSTQRGTYTILSSVSKNVLSFLKVFLFFLCLSFFRFSLGVLFYPFFLWIFVVNARLPFSFFFFFHSRPSLFSSSQRRGCLWNDHQGVFAFPGTRKGVI